MSGRENDEPAFRVPHPHPRPRPPRTLRFLFCPRTQHPPLLLLLLPLLPMVYPTTTTTMLRHVSGGVWLPHTHSRLASPLVMLVCRVRDRREHTVVFPEGGMGLTLTKELDGGCSVTKVVPGGVAHSRGVALGQRVYGKTAVANFAELLRFLLLTFFFVSTPVAACDLYRWKKKLGISGDIHAH